MSVRFRSQRPFGKRKRSLAIIFVVVLGLVALLADTANEGAKSITGPYLGLLGASATTIGIVAGLSELIGYSLRVVFGWLTDRTGRYWTLTFIGYGINLVAVPALALAGDWWMAVNLIVIERVGRAIRGPARDAMISHASVDIGRGWAYGVQEALSAVGGMMGPMIVFVVLLFKGDYRLSFEVLLVPALFALVLLAYAWRLNPSPRDMEGRCDSREVRRRLPRIYWVYASAGALIAAGYADYPLIAFHIDNLAQASESWIPILYAIAQAADALTALFLGRLYDRTGMKSLIIVSGITPFFALLIFSNDFNLVLLGMVFYGIGFGAQESVMRAIVADMVPYCRRASAFGYYNAVFGISWFMGSILMGILYDASIISMIAFSMAAQFLAIPVLMNVRRGFTPKKRDLETV
jgi:MFS family permease